MHNKWKYTPPPAPKRTAMDDLKQMVFYVILTLVVFYGVTGLLKFLFKPLIYLFRSSKDLYDEDIRKAEEKIAAREEYRKAFWFDDDNFLRQYTERFTLHTEKYQGDPNNALYEEWHKGFVNGTVFDPELNWAPEMYVKDELHESMPNVAFLDYLDRQISYMFKIGKFRDRCKFLKVITRYYPEFSPNFFAITKQIEELRCRASNHKMKNELLREISKTGIPVEIAAQFQDRGFKGEILEHAIKVFKSGLEKNLSQKMCWFCLRNNLDPWNEPDGLLKIVDDTLVNAGEAMATGLVKGSLTISDCKDILDMAKSSGDFYDDERRIRFVTYCVEQHLVNKSCKEAYAA